MKMFLHCNPANKQTNKPQLSLMDPQANHCRSFRMCLLSFSKSPVHSPFDQQQQSIFNVSIVLVPNRVTFYHCAKQRILTMRGYEAEKQARRDKDKKDQIVGESVSPRSPSQIAAFWIRNKGFVNMLDSLIVDVPMKMDARSGGRKYSLRVVESNPCSVHSLYGHEGKSNCSSLGGKWCESLMQ